MGDKVVCSVPGCDNLLSEEQKSKNIHVCSECEAAKMHLCELCSKKLSRDQIQRGATLCKECEMSPSDIQEGDFEMIENEDEYETEDFIV